MEWNVRNDARRTRERRIGGGRSTNIGYEEPVTKILTFLTLVFYIQSSSLLSFSFFLSLSPFLPASHFSATPTKLFRFFFLLISVSVIGSPCFSWSSSISVPGAWELLLLLLPRLRLHLLLPFQVTFLLFFIYVFIITFRICGSQFMLPLIEYSFVSSIPILRAMKYLTESWDYVFNSLFACKSGVGRLNLLVFSLVSIKNILYYLCFKESNLITCPKLILSKEKKMYLVC